MNRQTWLQMLGMWGVAGGSAPLAVPDAITDLVATANLAGTITVTWTLPDGATHARVRYNVDQGAAPAQPYLGISLGLVAGESVTLTGCEYGATYRFSAWAWNGAGYASAADTANATGPLNPLVYSSYLNGWLDARRETPITDNTAFTVPTEWSAESLITYAAGTNAPRYRTAGGAGNLNGLACWEWPAGTPCQWHAGAVQPWHATRGFAVAVLVQCSDAADTSQKTILSRFETGTNDRAFTLNKPGGEYQFNISPDGTTGTVKTATCTTTDDADPHGIVGVFSPSAYIAIYRDGVEDQRNTTTPAALIYGSSIEELRSGGARHNSGDAWLGKKVIELTYSEAPSPMSAIMLSDALAAIAGV